MIMYKSYLIILLIIISQVALIKKQGKYQYSKSPIKQFNMIEQNNIQLLDILVEANTKNSININNFLKKVDLTSQKINYTTT